MSIYSYFMLALLLIKCSTSFKCIKYLSIKTDNFQSVTQQSLLSSLRNNNELLPDDFFDVIEKDNAEPQLEPSKSSTVANYFEEIMKKLGKCSKKTLRDLITKYKPEQLPAIEQDMEIHITAALESLWSAKNGDWNGLILLASSELDDQINEADEYIKQAVLYGSKLSESKIKELLRKYNESGNIPKMDKRKYTGKLLKTDYLASLIDVLRETMEGDYKEVANFLKKESLNNMKKGFS